MIKKLYTKFTSKSKNDDREDMLNINELPDDALEKILILLPGLFLSKTASLVCKRWHNLIERDGFWTAKSLKDRKVNSNALRIIQDLDIYEAKKFYFKMPFHKNLLKNPCGEEGFNYWCIGSFSDLKSHLERITNCQENLWIHYMNKNLKNTEKIKSFEGFEIETDGHGAKELFDEKNVKIKKFTTTYYLCIKYQVVDLFNEGIDSSIFEKANPKIEISEFYAARFDCGSEYYIRVVLFDNNFNQLGSMIAFDDKINQWNDSEWHVYKHVIENCPKETRFILWFHGGKDTQYWAGHYGIKITKSCLRITF